MTSGGGAKVHDGALGSTLRNLVASGKGTDDVSMTGNEKMKKNSSKRAPKESSAASGPQQSTFAEKRQNGDQDSVTRLKAKNKKYEKVERKDQFKKDAIKEKQDLTNETNSIRKTAERPSFSHTFIQPGQKQPPFGIPGLLGMPGNLSINGLIQGAPFSNPLMML